MPFHLSQRNPGSLGVGAGQPVALVHDRQYPSALAIKRPALSDGNIVLHLATKASLRRQSVLEFPGLGVPIAIVLRIIADTRMALPLIISDILVQSQLVKAEGLGQLGRGRQLTILGFNDGNGCRR